MAPHDRYDKEKFIRLVQQNEILWKPQHPEFNNTTKCFDIFNSIAVQVGLKDGRNAKSKWKSLCDSRRHHMKIHLKASLGDNGYLKPKWPYMDLMSFLDKNHVAPTPEFWTYDEMKTLVGIWCSEDIQKGLKVMSRNKTVWQNIVNALSQSGYKRTEAQCKCKLRGLHVKYIKAVKEFSDIKEMQAGCLFFDELHCVFGKKNPKQRQTACDSSLNSKDDDMDTGDSHDFDSSSNLVIDLETIDSPLMNCEVYDDFSVDQSDEHLLEEKQKETGYDTSRAHQEWMMADSSNLPSFDCIALCEYFHKYCQNDLHAAKQWHRKERLGDDAIGKVKIRRHGNICSVSACVTSEMSISKIPCAVITDVDETTFKVTNIQCDGCTTAAGGCKHCIAVMTWLHRRSEEPPLDYVVSYWRRSALSRSYSKLQYMRSPHPVVTSREISATESDSNDSILIPAQNHKNIVLNTIIPDNDNSG